jgi:hypothetical protein
VAELLSARFGLHAKTGLFNPVTLFKTEHYTRLAAKDSFVQAAADPDKSNAAE